MTNIKFEDLPYRPCVGALILNPQGKVFIAERRSHPGAWQMPQGGIDAGEDPLEATFREVYEETGMAKQSLKLLAKASQSYRYEFPKHDTKIPYINNYRGQEQIWFALCFHGSDSEICFDILPHEVEFTNWRWAEYYEIPELAVPFKKEVYRQIYTEFEPLLSQFG